MKEVKPKYLQFLASEGYGVTFPQKDARILFSIDRRSEELIDIWVEDFSNPGSKQFLYKQFDSDIGNCLSDWDEWTLCDVLIKFFIGYSVPFALRKKVLLELSRVEEWRPQLAFWIWRNFREPE